MKLRHFYPCLLLAGMAVTMASCSEEATLSSGQGRNVTMTVNISRVGDNTRSILTEEDGNLKCTWEATDLILVVDKSGNKLGVLSLATGEGEETATFKGEINTEISGDAEINFLYLGSKTAEELNALANPVVLDYSSQDGTIGWLMKNDFFTGSQNVNITNSYVSVESVSLSRQISFGKFEMTLPDGVAYSGQPITVSGTGLNTKASVSMTDGSATFSEPGSITITRPEGTVSPEFYLTVLPATITPTFSVTIDGKTYSCTLAQKEWEASRFVRKDNLDGTYSGIILNMTKSADNPYEGYENEDPRNPLHKFAKYNLVRVGERGSLVNGFADSETENGALYQWGRNYGYMDDKGIFSQIEDEDDFINFEEAMGYIEQPNGENTQRYVDFYAYHIDGESALYTGTGGIALDPYSYYSPIIFDRPKYYDSIEVLKANPTKFFMDANYTTSSFVQKISAFYWYDTNPDYWLSSFGDGGNMWKARAKACGYSNETPCPDGWRLPTKEEFAAIAPEQNIENGSKNLTTLLKDYSELRYCNGVDYAIRWVYNVDYLKIQVLVVSSDFKKSDLADIRWDKETAVVTRLFPYTGAITTVGGYDGWDNEYVAFPYHRGIPDIGFFNTMMMGPGNNTNKALGGYWINEKGYFFKFMAGENVGLKQGQLMITEAAPSWAYAIRPVMDK